MSLYVLPGYWQPNYAEGELQDTPTSELQAIAPSSVIELFELQLNTAQHGISYTYRFHAGTSLNSNGNVYWDGNVYSAFPVEADGFEYSGTGQLPRPKLRVSNIMGTITALLLTLPNGLEGAKLTRIRTLARYLDANNFPGNVNPFGYPDPTATLPSEIYFVDRKSAETRDVVEFELAAAFDLQGVKAPKRQTVQNICQWRYRVWDPSTSSFDYTHVDCPYISTNYFTEDDTSTNNPALDVCSKRLTSCRLRFGEATVTGTATTGSSIITSISTTDLNRIGIGDLIKGYGLASGTTVTAKSASSITLSAASTGSTLVSGTGTIAVDGLSITMASVTGINAGMTVTGTYVPANTYVSSVNTTTNVVKLSISENTLVRTSVVTRTGTHVSGSVLGPFVNGPSLILLSNTSGIQVNDWVVSSVANQIYKGTKVSSIATSYSVTLSKAQAINNNVTVTATFYRSITPTAQTYTFTADNTYVIRAGQGIPFGSFPGVGGYR